MRYVKIVQAFSRDNGTVDTVPSWVREYERNLEKVSVRSAEEDRFVFDQISQIVGVKSKYSTVAEAVDDFRERTGLKQYLQSVEANNEQATKSASQDDGIVLRAFEALQKQNIPELIREFPELENAIRDFVKSRFGNVHPLAVIEDKVRVWLRDKNIESDKLNDKNLSQYINNIIIEEKNNNKRDDVSYLNNIGKMDMDSSVGKDSEKADDAFTLLMPAGK